MSSRFSIIKAMNTGQRPTGRLPGEMYVNFPDNMFGVMDERGVYKDLLAVSVHSAKATYSAGDYVKYSGVLYQCTTSHTAKAFSNLNWIRASLFVKGSTLQQAVTAPGIALVGVGTQDPQASLHVAKILDTQVLVESTSPATKVSSSSVFLKNSLSTWNLSNTPAGALSIGKDGTGNQIVVIDRDAPANSLQVHASGRLTLIGDPLVATDAATKKYVDDNSASLWAKVGASDDIFYDKGNVGINQPAPATELDVIGTITGKSTGKASISLSRTDAGDTAVYANTGADTVVQVKNTNNVRQSRMLFSKGPRTKWSVGVDKDDYFGISPNGALYTDPREELSISTAGHIGIGARAKNTDLVYIKGNLNVDHVAGTTTPLTIQSKVSGHIATFDNIFDASINIESPITKNVFVRFGYPGALDKGWSIGSDAGNSRAFVISTSDNLKPNAAKTTGPKIIINRNGQVGINKVPTGAYDLEVKGKGIFGNALILRSQATGLIAPDEALSYRGFQRYQTWHKNAKGIDYGSGNVGIGTTNPTQKLDVNGNIKVHTGYFSGIEDAGHFTFTSTSAKPQQLINWQLSGKTFAQMGTLSGGNLPNKLLLYTALPNAPLVLQGNYRNANNVGIGNAYGYGATPVDQKLCVQGNIKAQGGIFSSPVTLRALTSATPSHNEAISLEYLQRYWRASYKWTNDTHGVHTTANVGIGEASHASYDLIVKGTSYFRGSVVGNAGSYTQLGVAGGSPSSTYKLNVKGGMYADAVKSKNLIITDGVHEPYKCVGSEKWMAQITSTAIASDLKSTQNGLLVQAGQNYTTSHHAIVARFGTAKTGITCQTIMDVTAYPDQVHIYKNLYVDGTSNLHAVHCTTITNSGDYTGRNATLGGNFSAKGTGYFKGHVGIGAAASRTNALTVVGTTATTALQVGTASTSKIVSLLATKQAGFEFYGAHHWRISAASNTSFSITDKTTNAQPFNFKPDGQFTAKSASFGEFTTAGYPYGEVHFRSSLSHAHPSAVVELTAKQMWSLQSDRFGNFSVFPGTGGATPTYVFQPDGKMIVPKSLDIGIAATAKITTELRPGLAKIHLFGASPWNIASIANHTMTFEYGAGAAKKVFIYKTNGDLQIPGHLIAAGSRFPSDMRLKENIAPIHGALGKIEQLEGFTYNLKRDPKQRLAGLSAQAVQSVQPESVFEGDDKYLTLDYGTIVPLLVEGIKDLSEENRLLRAQAQQHEDKLSRMESRLAKLEQLIQKLD